MMNLAEIHGQSLTTSAFLSQVWVESVISPIDVISVLNAARVSFVLVGAHGLGGWMGKPRATQDVDVVVMARHVKRAVKTLSAAFPDLVVQDLGAVIRFQTREAGTPAIDVIKQRELFREAFRHSRMVSAAGQTYRIPSLEMALAMKFAAMISPNRGDAERYQDAHDFIRMVQLHGAEGDRATLRALGEAVYSGGGEGLLEMIRKVQAGEKLTL